MDEYDGTHDLARADGVPPSFAELNPAAVR
jgi:hypothetical protein